MWQGDELHSFLYLLPDTAVIGALPAQSHQSGMDRSCLGVCIMLWGPTRGHKTCIEIFVIPQTACTAGSSLAERAHQQH